MMHYSKGDNVEKEATREDLVKMFEDCTTKEQKNFLWMHVKGGTKLDNVITYAKNAFNNNEYRTVVWSGHGGGVVKTVSCAEIFKRKFPLYQVTRMCYTTVEEHWLPQMSGLEEIIANREVPTIHILMSLDPIDDKIEGVQKPNQKSLYWGKDKERQGSSSYSDRYDKQIERNKNRGGNRNNQQSFPQNERKSNNQSASTGEKSAQNENQENKSKKFNKRQQHKKPKQPQTDNNDDQPSTSQQAQESQTRPQEKSFPHPRQHNNPKRFRPKKNPNTTGQPQNEDKSQQQDQHQQNKSQTESKSSQPKDAKDDSKGTPMET